MFGWPKRKIRNLEDIENSLVSKINQSIGVIQKDVATNALNTVRHEITKDIQTAVNNKINTTSMAVQKLQILQSLLTSVAPAGDVMPGSDPKFERVFDEDDLAIIRKKVMGIITDEL